MKKIDMIKRPTWNEYWLLSTYWISQRSPDSQTKCGCVIVDKDNCLVSQGYNGFLSGIDDSDLPTERPDKYRFCIHAELNALLIACKQGKSVKDCVAYISGEPCIRCLQYLYQSGIRDIMYTDFSKPNMNNEDDEIRKILLKKMGVGYGTLRYSFIPSNELRYKLCVIT